MTRLQIHAAMSVKMTTSLQLAVLPVIVEAVMKQIQIQFVAIVKSKINSIRVETLFNAVVLLVTLTTQLIRAAAGVVQIGKFMIQQQNFAAMTMWGTSFMKPAVQITLKTMLKKGTEEIVAGTVLMRSDITVLCRLVVKICRLGWET